MHGVQKENSVNRRSMTRLPSREFDITFLGAESATRPTRRVFGDFTVRNSTIDT